MMKKEKIKLKNPRVRNRVQRELIRQGRHAGAIEPKKGKGHHYNRQRDGKIPEE